MKQCWILYGKKEKKSPTKIFIKKTFALSLVFFASCNTVVCSNYWMVKNRFTVDKSIRGTVSFLYLMACNSAKPGGELFPSLHLSPLGPYPPLLTTFVHFPIPLCPPPPPFPLFSFSLPFPFPSTSPSPSLFPFPSLSYHPILFFLFLHFRLFTTPRPFPLTSPSLKNVLFWTISWHCPFKLFIIKNRGSSDNVKPVLLHAPLGKNNKTARKSVVFFKWMMLQLI